MHILIGYSQSIFRETLKECLCEAFKRHRLTVDEAADEAEVMDKSSRQVYDFLVVSLDLPPNQALPADQARRGLTVVGKLKESGVTTRCLILVPAEVPPDALPQLTSMSCLVVTERAEMLDDIVSALRSTLAKGKVRPHLSLMMVQDPNSSNWNFLLDGGGSFGFQQRRGAFPIPPRLITSLVERSKAIPIADDWLAEMGRIGQDLCALIFRREDAFSRVFRNAVESAGGIDSVRLSFDISPSNYSLAVEALVDPDDEKMPANRLPFWMLKTPIYRSLSLQSPCRTLGEPPRSQLFTSARPINCLIIQADAEGEIKLPGMKCSRSFDRLVNIAEECEQLESRFLKNKKQWRIGNVERIKPEGGGSRTSFKERLRKSLAANEWHLLHFCGHSYYQPDLRSTQGNGYLMLPGKRIEALDARVFAHWLGKTQFLFLSSCHSSEEAFAFEMARNYIPAVLGFRWAVDDLFVPGFVKSFYEHLFASGSIESAFVASRKQVRRKLGVNNPLWAAPMLVLLQPEHVKPADRLSAPASDAA